MINSFTSIEYDKDLVKYYSARPWLLTIANLNRRLIAIVDFTLILKQFDFNNAFGPQFKGAEN